MSHNYFMLSTRFIMPSVYPYASAPVGEGGRDGRRLHSWRSSYFFRSERLTALKAKANTQRVGMMASVTYQQGLERFTASVAERSIIRKFSLAMRTFHRNVPPAPNSILQCITISNISQD
jgi:hypothetical protein